MKTTGKPKRNRRRWGCGGCAALLAAAVVCGGVLNLLGYNPSSRAAATTPTRLAAQSASTAVPTLALGLATNTTVPPTATPRPATAAPSASPAGTSLPATFDEAAYVEALANGLFILAGGRNVETVRVADGRANGGERVVIVSYLTTESTEVGYVDEWIDLFSALAATISADALDVDSVALIAGTATGQAAAALSTRVMDLLAFQRGEITRGAFLQRLETTTF